MSDIGARRAVRTMHRLMAAVLLAAVLVGAAPALAADEDMVTYDLEEVGISIAIPSTYDVFTHETPVDDPVYKKYEMPKDVADAYFLDENQYLEALNPRNEIQVIMEPTSTTDFREFNSLELAEINALLQEKFEAKGPSAISCELYRHGDVAYYRLYYIEDYDTSSPYYCLRYVTMFDGKGLMVTMIAYEPIDQEAAQVMQKVIDNIKYHYASPYISPVLVAGLTALAMLAAVPIVMFVQARRRSGTVDASKE